MIFAILIRIQEYVGVTGIWDSLVKPHLEPRTENVNLRNPVLIARGGYLRHSSQFIYEEDLVHPTTSFLLIQKR